MRAKTSLVVEAGDVRETHHFATLIGYGASAINPYLAYSALADLHSPPAYSTTPLIERKEVLKIYRKAIGKGLLKIMSKIGISTLQSYQGAQIFEVLGLKP